MLYPLDEMMKAVKLAEGIVQAEVNEKESHYDTDNEHEDESASERGFGDNGGGRRVSDGAFVFDNDNRYVENYVETATWVQNAKLFLIAVNRSLRHSYFCHIGLFPFIEGFV